MTASLFAVVLLVGDRLHPVNGFAFELFLNSNMGQRAGRRGAMPIIPHKAYFGHDRVSFKLTARIAGMYVHIIPTDPGKSLPKAPNFWHDPADVYGLLIYGLRCLLSHSGQWCTLHHSPVFY